MFVKHLFPSVLSAMKGWHFLYFVIYELKKIPNLTISPKFILKVDNWEKLPTPLSEQVDEVRI